MNNPFNEILFPDFTYKNETDVYETDSAACYKRILERLKTIPLDLVYREEIPGILFTTLSLTSGQKNIRVVLNHHKQWPKVETWEEFCSLVGVDDFVRAVEEYLEVSGMDLMEVDYNGLWELFVSTLNLRSYLIHCHISLIFVRVYIALRSHIMIGKCFRFKWIYSPIRKEYYLNQCSDISYTEFQGVVTKALDLEEQSFAKWRRRIPYGYYSVHRSSASQRKKQITDFWKKKLDLTDPTNLLKPKK